MRWRQVDLAGASGVSQSVISRIERGRLDGVALPTLRRVGAALDIRLTIDAWWRAGDADRLADRGHAALVEFVLAELQAHGWIVRAEETFNHFGERGSADIVAWHPAERILLIVEVKTRIGDAQELLSTYRRKVRILPGILERTDGWRPRSVVRLLVVADTRATRATIDSHRATFDSVWPARTAAVRRWIRRPIADAIVGGILFVVPARLGAGAAAGVVERVRRRADAA